MGVKRMNLGGSPPKGPVAKEQSHDELVKCTRLDAASYLAKCAVAILKVDLAGYFLAKGLFKESELTAEEQRYVLPANIAKVLIEELGDEYYSIIENFCQMANEYGDPIEDVWPNQDELGGDDVLSMCGSVDDARNLCRYYTCQFEDGEYAFNPWTWSAAFGVNLEGVLIPEAFKVCDNLEINALSVTNDCLHVAEKIISGVSITKELSQFYTEESLAYDYRGSTCDNTLFLMAEAKLFKQLEFQNIFLETRRSSSDVIRIRYSLSGCDDICLTGSTYRISDSAILEPYVRKLNAEGIKCEIITE